MAKMRSDQWMVPGQIEAQRRLGTHKRVEAAFESLEVFPVQTAAEYLGEQLNYVKNAPSPEEIEQRAFANALSFAIVCVEADRRRNQSG